MAAEITLHSVDADHSISQTQVSAVYNAWSACDGGNPEIDLMPLRLITHNDLPQIGDSYDLDDDLPAPALIVTSVRPGAEVTEQVRSEKDGKLYKVRPIRVQWGTNEGSGGGSGGGRPPGESSLNPEDWIAEFQERSERVQFENPTGKFWGLWESDAEGCTFRDSLPDVSSLKEVESVWDTGSYHAKTQVCQPILNALGEKFSETSTYSAERAVRTDVYRYRRLIWNDSNHDVSNLIYNINDADFTLRIPARGLTRFYPKHTAKLSATGKTAERFIYTTAGGVRAVVNYFTVSFEIAFDPLGWLDFIPNVSIHAVVGSKLLPFMHRGKLKPEFVDENGVYAGPEKKTFLVYSPPDSNWYDPSHGFVDGQHIIVET